MYKKQMIFQKVACLIAVVAAAATFVYSLGIITDIYDSLYSTMKNVNDLTQTEVPGSIIYYDMQDFNKTFMHLALGLILVSCTLYLTNTNIRRKYYVGNYVSSVLFAVCALGISIWSHIRISAFKVQYLTTVDFEALKAYAEKWGETYIESTFFLDLHYFVCLLNIAAAVMLLVNLYWKKDMMKKEDALIAQGKEA